VNRDEIWREKLHDLGESLQVFEYIVHLLEKENYTFSDSDAPQYIREMKKATVVLRTIRDSVQSIPRQDP
jgi:hypothetical protein